MPTFELTNPRVLDKSFKSEVSASSPKKAAKEYFKVLSKQIKNKGEYHFLFTLKDKTESNYYHFDGHLEQRSGKSKILKVSSYQMPTKKQHEKQDILNISNLKGGEKKKKKKKKSDDDDSDDDSDDDKEDMRAYVDKMMLNYLNYPITTLYYYDPFIYRNLHYTDYVVLDNYLIYPNLVYPLFQFPYTYYDY